MKLARTNALLPFAPYDSGDFTGKEGYPVLFESSENAVQLAADATGEPPFGVIVHAAKNPELVTVAIAAGGLAGTVRLRLLQPTTAGKFLKVVTVGGATAFGPDTGTGERIVMAQALESGAAGELIEGVIFKPIYHAS